MIKDFDRGRLTVMGAMLVRHEPKSAAAVRREIAADLAGHGIRGADVDDVTLVASELVSNAVRHATTAAERDLDVTWTVGDQQVLIAVADESELRPKLSGAAPDAPCGRGLTIVDALASDWGVDPMPDGKRVWAKIPLHRNS